MADAPEPFRALDWEPARARDWAHRAGELWSELLAHIETAPVARAWPRGSVRNAVALNIPAQPLSDDAIFEHLRAVALNYSVYPGSPRFMGYVSGPGTVPGAAADLVAAALNQNLGGWRLSPAATEIELALTHWFAERFGLPQGAGGIVVSGGAIANLTALKVARDRATAWRCRDEGIRELPQVRIYATEETHAVVRRASDILGLGMGSISAILVDDNLRMRVDVLDRTIRRDRDKGLLPIAVVGTAGTVGTGAVDPLTEIADVCERESLWFHVDAAYGGPAVLAPDLRPLLDGIERADSIAFDPHKWMYTPIAGGCTMFRRMDDAFRSYDVPATYTVEDVERTGTTFDFGSHGPQWSRPFWALKIWVSLLAHGTDAYAERISHDAALARYMAARVEAAPDMELMAPVSLSICCFRYVPRNLDVHDDQRDAFLDALNEEIMTRLQLDGRAYCSNAMVRGRLSLRACIVNFRTERDDVDALLSVVREIGSTIMSSDLIGSTPHAAFFADRMDQVHRKSS